MHHRKKVEGLSVMDAVDNLTQMAEIDLSAPTPQKSAPTGLTEEQISEQLQARSWHDPDYFLYNRERVKETFRALHGHLKQVYERQKGHLRDVETQRGIQAIMLLAAEAAQRMDAYAAKMTGTKKEERIEELKEYQELQEYYQTKIFHKFQNYLEIKEGWQNEWSHAAEGEVLDPQRQGLKDLESVRRDKEYELFLLRNEEGKPFFNQELLRHLRLVGEFDTVFAEIAGEDPLDKVKVIQDRDVHLAAKEILHLVSPHVDDFYKEALSHKQIDFVACINKAIMALMLAANPRNLMQNTSGKSCLNYFADFHFYLRKALSSSEYKKAIAASFEATPRFFHVLLTLAQGLSSSFFMRSANRKEMILFIRSLIDEGAKANVVQPATRSPASVWNQLIDEDAYLREALKKYRSGPLMRAVDLFRKEGQLVGYDPLAQDNVPSQLFTLEGDQMHISCLKIPSPVRQESIDKAELTEEFDGFVRSLGSQRHLFINLQDRTSWQDHARCRCLEELQKRREFAKSLIMVALPKSGDFYTQSGNYTDLNDAKEFMEAFKEQIASGEACGYFLSGSMQSKQIQAFLRDSMPMVHSLFFSGKGTLMRKNRLDFIEIFHLLLILKIIDVSQPDTISFTCKDAIDAGAATSAEFYAFMSIMNGLKDWDKQGKDFLNWMLHSSALTLRERAIDQQCLSRVCSALTLISAELEAHREEVIRAISKLYTLAFFHSLAILQSA